VTADDQKLPKWKLERYLLEELPAAEMASIQAQVEADPAQASRLEELRQSNEEILSNYPAAWMGRQIERRARGPATSSASNRVEPWWSRFRLLPVPAAVLIALLAALPLFRGGDETGDPGVPLAIRLKGAQAHLLLHRKTADGDERLRDGALAREHDQIQFQYQAAGQAYGLILSIDGAGQVTRHFPDMGGRAASLQQAGVVSLEFAYELDDAPGWERFYFITAAVPFDVDAVMAAAHRLATASGSSADAAAEVARTQAMGTQVMGAQAGEALVARPAVELDSLDVPMGLEQSLFTLRKESSTQ
jgi:microcystin-dependent protein